MTEREMLDEAMRLLRQVRVDSSYTDNSDWVCDVGDLERQWTRQERPTPNLVTREELAPVMDALEALTEKAIEGDPDLLFKWLAVREFASGLRHCKNARGEGE